MNRIIILLMAAILPMILVAQPTEVAAKKIRATEKLQLSNKTLTAIVESITVLSTHAQSPTAKAVYDLTAAMITSVSTNATLSGNGTVGDPLSIAQQSATSGQVLKWNGSAWLPAADDNTTQTISYSAPNLSLSSGGGSVAIPQGSVTSVSVTPTEGVTASVANATTTPNISIGLGDITPLSVVASGNVRGANITASNGIFTANFAGKTVEIAPTATAVNIQSFGSVPLDLNPFGNLVRFPSIAPSVLSYLGMNTDGSLQVQPELSVNASYVELQSFSKPLYLNRQGNDIYTGNVNFGINTTSPARSLHVAGIARITGTGSTAITLTGRDANSDITNVSVGAGLSLSGGTLSSTATGTVGGTGVAGKVAYWSGTNTLTSTTNFPFDGTSLAVGRSTAGAGRFNVTGNSTSVGLQVDAGTLPSFGVTAQLRGSNATTNQSIYGIDAEGSTVGTSSNYLNKFFNTGTGSTIMQLGTPTTGGNVAVQYNITGGGSVWSSGIINSDSDKFKIEPNTSLGDAATGLTITTAGLFGINNQSPGASLDMDATTDGIALSSGNTANRPASALRWLRYNSNMSGLETRISSGSSWHVLNSSKPVNLTAGSALGSAPTITINNGTEMAYTVSLTVGTAPTANAVIFTRTFPDTWSVAPTVVFSAANQVTASEITKFYVDTQTTGQYTIRVNGTLSTPQTYKLNIILRN